MIDDDEEDPGEDGALDDGEMDDRERGGVEGTCDAELDDECADGDGVRE